jgi:hypothetical protein
LATDVEDAGVNGLLKLATGVLVSLLVVTYVAAKIHFFTYAGNLQSYWAEHRPYTAALALISVTLWGIVALRERRPGG